LFSRVKVKDSQGREDGQVLKGLFSAIRAANGQNPEDRERIGLTSPSCDEVVGPPLVARLFAIVPSPHKAVKVADLEDAEVLHVSEAEHFVHGKLLPGYGENEAGDEGQVGGFEGVDKSRERVGGGRALVERSAK